ncbi:3-hydroxyacyl- dehyrogenase [Pyrenophora seminiperda CCB06]|uniref:3-hydroxyacyl-dehyrogenase n=1 Tax=Pyrenophora seminiperda CCB06 TaxID=1302712 RepID=A0A3M7M7C9_9PLEO|nr:3-hydroxyacyl- dehyrogenase [Pyrenophora seminiperda CCB06]
MSPTSTMLSLLVLIALLRLATAQSFIILDTGLYQSGTSALQSPTSLRRLPQDGSNSTTLAQFTAASTANSAPTGAHALAYSPSSALLFSATSQGLISTKLDGSGASNILSDNNAKQIPGLTVAEKEQKIYYSDPSTTSIKKADFNGTNTELVRNVSQGTDFYATGLVVDEARGWIYWSATSSTNSDRGSIFRAALNGTGDAQLLVSGISAVPGQLRIVVDSLYWLENTPSATSIKYLDRFISQLPPTPTTTSFIPVPTGVLISSSQSSLFSVVNDAGEVQKLAVSSFYVYRDDFNHTVWLVAKSVGRNVFAMLVEVVWRGSGGSRGPVFKVLSQGVATLGVPVGLEYVR